MALKTTFLIGYFSEMNNEHRFCSPAANNVCTYLRDVLARFPQQLCVINLAQSKKHFYFSKHHSTSNGNVVEINAPCFGSGRLLSPASRVLLSAWVKRMLKKIAHREDNVIIYHSLNTLALEEFVSQNYNSVLQLEEVYCDVVQKKRRTGERELHTINLFRKHIFVSQSMKNDSRIRSVQSVVLYGSYLTSKAVISEVPDPTSIVYAGTLESNKGIDFACDLMKTLPAYTLDVYGHGSKNRVEQLKEKYRSYGNIRFFEPVGEGALSIILPRYRFGLSPLDPTSGFGSTTFPSKILTYLRSGLTVISSKFQSVLDSPLKDCVVFADYTLDSFREAILSFREEAFLDSKRLMLDLDLDFQHELARLLYEK